MGLEFIAFKSKFFHISKEKTRGEAHLVPSRLILRNENDFILVVEIIPDISYM